MKPIKFKGENLTIGEGQKEYKQLPAFVDPSQPIVPFSSCWIMEEEEKEEFLKTGKIWVTQLTFGNRYAPMQLNVSKPKGIGKFADPKAMKAKMEQAEKNMKAKIKAEKAIPKFEESEQVAELMKKASSILKDIEPGTKDDVVNELMEKLEKNVGIEEDIKIIK
ncbi:MAG: hypothetical protein Unbinned5350contig1001_44 [Prokaryotic dsDNA virus sp.]|nr:MAG: hypothetical protein Unbinned5350contig1001_44 [Prokaryotic dsDNA virus sp.]|tara:strand:- start:10134 stop:10625 length:492 start_codon:yes stop_codon:yes gene_type:complete